LIEPVRLEIRHMNRRLQQIVTLFEEHGNSQYGGEAVTQLEHALQAAYLAEQQQSPPTLIAAALLHDVGHLLHNLPDDAPEQGIDDRHEQLGARYLTKHFVRETVDPIRLHVASKRYLCTVEPEYAAALSQPSLTSLQLQGGKMNDGERAAFEAEPSYADAVKVRRWDDEAKVAGLVTPPLAHYIPALESSLLPRERR
jgi:phosphonate degradation associated HDIG domain protein